MAKRLDRFLLSEPLIEKLTKYRYGVDQTKLSDHHPIFLEFEMGDLGPPRPFKFNQEWLKVEGYKDLVYKVCSYVVNVDGLPPMDILIEKLSRLKVATKGWVKTCATSDKKSLHEIQSQIGILFEKNLSGHMD